MLSDKQWARVEAFLPGKIGDSGRIAKNNRKFVEAVFWIMQTGNSWRSLPPEMGHWHRTFVRFARWRKNGIWDKIKIIYKEDDNVVEIYKNSKIKYSDNHP